MRNPVPVRRYSVLADRVESTLRFLKAMDQTPPMKAAPVTSTTLALILPCMLLASCSKSEHELRMIKPRLEVDQKIATDFARVMNERSSIRIELEDHDENLQRTGIEALLADRADIALVSNNEAYASGITTVMPMYANVLHVLVDRAYIRDEQDEVSSTRELQDIFTSVRVFAGPPGAPSRVMLQEFATEKGIAEGTIDFVEQVAEGDAGWDDCAEMFVVFAPVLRDIEKRIKQCREGDYLLVGLGRPDSVSTGSAIDASTLLNPSLKAFVIPADVYGNRITPNATLTLAVDKMLVARDDVATAAVYDLISEVLRLRPALAANEPTLFHGLSDEFTSSDSTFVLHPGAQDYIERNEPTIYERYSGVAEVAVTLFVAVFSGLFAAVRIYNIRRKNLIDEFYSEAIHLRSAVTDESSMSHRNSTITAIRTLQTKAFEMLVDEKLAADESFRIFITLSNDIIDELKQPSAPDWSLSSE